VVDPVSLSTAPMGSGTRLYWNPVPGALSYTMVRGDVTSLREVSESIDLGAVSCITGSADPADTFREDPLLPGPDRAFFYLVAFDAVQDSSYGTAGASKPRSPSSGGCQGLATTSPSPVDGTDPSRRQTLRSP